MFELHRTKRALFSNFSKGLALDVSAEECINAPVGVLLKRRTVTIVVSLVDAAVWIVVAVAAFASGSDPATKGLDQAAGWVVTALFLVTGAPALVLALMNRAPTTALILALAFPAAFGAAFVAAVIAFA